MEGINEAHICGRGEARAIVEIQAKRGQKPNNYYEKGSAKKKKKCVLLKSGNPNPGFPLFLRQRHL